MQKVKVACKMDSRGNLTFPNDLKPKLLSRLTEGHVLATFETINPKTYEQIKTIHGPLITFLGEQYEERGRIYNKKQLKQMFKLIVGYYEELQTNKGVVPIPLSFADASKDKLTEIIDFFQKFCIENFGNCVDLSK